MNPFANIGAQIAIGLVAAVIIVLLYLAFQGLRRPVLAKLGIRNIPRRPTQSFLIIVGLMLSTIIIVSALSIGDTLNYSVQRHAINAYGAIDQIIAPPLLSVLAQLAGTPSQTEESEASEQSPEEQLALNANLQTILRILDEGLPGIDTSRYEQLRQRVSQEPMIDGIAPSIIFPTIIRNVSTGQGEPLGFVVAVDDQYTAEFGLHTVDGQPVQMASLRNGIGNIFEVSRNLFALTTQQVGQQLGLGELRVSDLIKAVAAVGAIAADPNSLGSVIQESGILSNTTILQQTGILSNTQVAEQIDAILRSEALSQTLRSMGVSTDTIASLALGASTPLSTTNAVTQSGANNLLASLDPSTLLSSLNLNTLSEELDSMLGQLGLELRQGDVYLNQWGAQQLDARVGDRLDLFLGPIPLPYRVAGIVNEAGPLGALSPVVMLRLDEAQHLLFMQNRINNILISNRGDAIEGLQLTNDVTKRLRILALNDQLVAEIVAKLRTPDYRRALTAGLAKEKSARLNGPEAEIPEWARPWVEQLTGSAEFLGQIEQLQQALDQPEGGEQLRVALSQQEMRSWLTDLPLSKSEVTSWRTLLEKVNELDVLDALNKQTVVTASNIAGNVFTTIFTIFGVFSIVAGILLIFLIFVMLAAERRSEMGVARALGVQRSHLVQMFVTEGMLYDLAAATLGLGLGLLVSFAMVGFIGNLFNQVTGQAAGRNAFFAFYFNITPLSLIVGYCLGVLFTYLVVTWSSARVSRLNIVTAIRDLPDDVEARPRSTIGKVWQWLAGSLWIVLGVVVINSSSRQTILLTGITLIVIGCAVLLARFLERRNLTPVFVDRLQYTTIGLGLLLLWGVPWSRFLSQNSGQNNASVLLQEGPTYLLTFVLGPVLLILGTIMLVMYNAELLSWLVTRSFGRFTNLGPILKTAVAYPLSTRFRTGMAMVMFAMIVCTVTVMALVIEATQALIVMDEKDSGGFEISTTNTLLSIFDPVTDMQSEMTALQERYPLLKQVTMVGGVASQNLQAEQTGAGQGWGQLDVNGINNGYLAQAQAIYRFKARAPGYADDSAIWQALRQRDDVAIITPDLLRRRSMAERAERPTPSAGDEEWLPRFALQGIADSDTELPKVFLNLRTASNASPSHRLQVIAVLDDDRTRAGGELQINLAALAKIAGQPVRADHYYLKVQSGADVKKVAQEVERAFLGNGVNASVMAEGFAQGQAITRGVLRLLQGFMALGLLVGIVALGVISSRTVVERRQQIGVLRAIGYQARMVGASFVLEASFVALTGILIGVAVGILLGDNLIRSLFTDLTPQTQLRIPWGQLAGILGLAYLFSLLATSLSAWQAARIYPAEALRYE
jgi:putative ABC transport system permease protein